MTDDLSDLRQIPRRLLYRNNVFVLRQLESRCRLDVTGGTTRNVVDDDWRRHRIRDRPEVGNDSALRRLVVHRRRVEQVRRAGRLHLARKSNRFLGVVRRGARHDRDPPGRLLHRYLHYSPVLGYGHGGGFTSGPTGNDEVNAARDLPVDKGSERALVDFA